jgi:hypothetical protein
MFIKFKVSTFILSVTFASAAFADQAAYIEKNEALAAKSLLEKSSTVKFFCAPCGDNKSHSTSVKKITVIYTGYQKYWQVHINNQGIDLAYTYFLKNNKWINAAIAIGLPVDGIPEFIN